MFNDATCHITYMFNVVWICDLMKVVRSGDLVSYCAEEGVRLLGEGKFLVSDSFPGNERTKYCLTSKVHVHYYPQLVPGPF